MVARVGRPRIESGGICHILGFDRGHLKMQENWFYTFFRHRCWSVRVCLIKNNVFIQNYELLSNETSHSYFM